MLLYVPLFKLDLSLSEPRSIVRLQEPRPGGFDQGMRCHLYAFLAQQQIQTLSNSFTAGISAASPIRRRPCRALLQGPIPASLPSSATPSRTNIDFAYLWQRSSGHAPYIARCDRLLRLQRPESPTCRAQHPGPCRRCMGKRQTGQSGRQSCSGDA